MDGTEFRFEKGARVRLRDGVDPSFYNGMSVLGNEGWIDARRRDERFGLPEVHITWDKNHWTYNGAPDRWTFEDHFDPAEETMTEPSRSDLAKQLANQFAEGLAKLFESTPEAAPEAPEVSIVQDDADDVALRRRVLQAMGLTDDEEDAQEPDIQKQFEAAINMATKKLSGSEAFIVVGVERAKHEAAEGGLLTPYAFGFSRSPQGELVVTSYMSRVAADSHQELALQMIADA